MAAFTKLTIRDKKPEDIYNFSKMMFGGRIRTFESDDTTAYINTDGFSIAVSIVTKKNEHIYGPNTLGNIYLSLVYHDKAVEFMKTYAYYFGGWFTKNDCGAGTDDIQARIGKNPRQVIRNYFISTNPSLKGEAEK